MSTYNWPSGLYPSSYSLTWQELSATFKSPLTGTQQTIVRPGGRWLLEMQFTNLTQALGQQLEGFLWRIASKENRARIQDFSYAKQGTCSGSVTVSGAGQTGSTLVVSGKSGTLLAGDRITVEEALYVIGADSSGSSLYLTTPLRNSPANGASVNYSAPTALFVLAEDFTSTATPGVFKNYTAKLEEIFP